MSAAYRATCRLFTQEGFNQAFEAYRVKYIATGSFAPIAHLLAFVGGVSYIREFSHLRHKKQAAREAAIQQRIDAAIKEGKTGAPAHAHH
ncbi:mitochondrial Complex V (CV) F1Fo ATP synthase Fo subunit f Atp17 [Andalucia godoyi]|uniref:Mitochondrial Complex V (CV) F1Fo ATP synthase Fo subunit f Atp17 n=1 Tax=Andalucia godoyi TaxID=505711 RepID=A0A8K0F118_ANDGO|nr:mitochondrial Complex V (CV) F1Fo ATP synthase Fo subunit f Atp17 [Andalucia godoyi]|eukprot:ANDGO_03367.mRNA.1 mitochondrial Complex V (CV) F1Fo ATP synthase Fo subunit f Atp17